MRRTLVVIVVLVSLLTASGCGSSSGSSTTSSSRPTVTLPTVDRIGSGSATSGEESEGPTVEVPDAAGQDGSVAVSDIETEGFVPVLADANDDPYFDTARDPDGCDVLDQDPAAGERLEEGGEVTLTVDCRQVDWDNQEGSDWDAFDSAYQTGFDDGCDALFAMSPDGSLYEDDTEYTVLDCQLVRPSSAADAADLPVEVPDEPEPDGAALGALDGCRMTFSENFISTLSYGDDSVSELDCESIAATVAPPPAAQSRKKKRSAGSVAAGRSCSAAAADGAPVVLEFTRGSVSCDRAAALWVEYVRRAPSEGQGSAAYVAVDGWSCATSPPNKAPRLGSCVNLSDKTEFVAYAG